MSVAKALSGLVEPKKKARAIVKVAEEKPPSLVRMIDDVLVHRTKKLKFFRPSMLHGCKRQNVFHYIRAPHHPSRQDPRMLRILDNGTKVHEILQEYLGDLHEWWFVRESRIYVKVAGAWVRGSCDGVLIRRSDMYRFGVEIKSIASASFTKLTKPDPKHVFQASIYMKLQGLQWMVILYWDKDKQNLKEFPVKYNPKAWDELQAKVEELKTYVDNKKLPKYDPSTCDVSFCQSVDYCRKLGAPV